MSEIVNQTNAFRQIAAKQSATIDYARLQSKVKALRLPYPVKLGLVATCSATLGFGIIFTAQEILLGMLHAS